MADMCTQSYLDNDLARSCGQSVSNELILTLEDPLDEHFKLSLKFYGWTKVFEFK